MDTIRVGVVGLGGRGLHWMRLLQNLNGYRITAICDPITALHERARSVLRHPEEAAVYSRYEDILGDPNVDAIALCVRCQEQGALAAQALEAGKHVNAEVPAAHIRTEWDLMYYVEVMDRKGNGTIHPDQEIQTPYIVVKVQR